MSNAKPRILIVDDQEFNRIVLHDIMITLSYQPFVAKNGREALDCLIDIKPDVMILDVMMPVMNGFDVLSHLRKDPSIEYVPVIIVSALDDVESISKGILLGAEDFLTKPFNQTILKTRIESCLFKKKMHDMELNRRYELERELSEAKSQLMHSDRLASMGQVAASVAHDVNNKIAAIINRVALIARMNAVVDQKIHINLQKIDSICRGSSGLLRHLLDFSRGEQVEMRELDIHGPIENALSLVEHKISTKGIGIKFNRWESPLKMTGNSDQLEQVFMNLFINAGDAMENGGSLSISLSVVPDNSHMPFIKIECADTGTGIRAEILDKIFLPFFTTKPKGKGTGLGMYIIKQIVDAHTGKIHVTSIPDKGTTFTLLFPSLSIPSSDNYDPK
ncbi:response regulator [bacterium]|nr:response regulator [candidate division CSSED10-310 bacterium]